MKKVILFIALLVLLATDSPLSAQQPGISSLTPSGQLTWTNGPLGAISCVQTVQSLHSTGAWASALLTLTGTAAVVSIAPTHAAFYRILAYPATNIAYYPLITDSNDASAHYGPMTLQNTPFTNGGIYCDGQYGPTYAYTPTLTALDFSGFLVSVDFMVTNTTLTKPVFVGGTLWRWGGFYVRSDGTVGLLCNDAGPYPGTVAYTTNRWHQAVLLYMETNQTFEIYLDGVLAGRRQAPLNHHDNRNVAASHYGTGQTFNGYLRNLRVYNLNR